MKLMQSIYQSVRVQRWLRRRLPSLPQVILNQKRIFIFLSAEGALYSVLLFIVFIAGVNYANNLVLGFCFFLGSVLVVTIHHTYAHLSGLQLEMVDALDSAAGSSAQYRIKIAPTGRRPHRQIRIEWVDQVQQIDTLSAGQVLVFQLPTPQRGRFVPPQLKVSTIYPLGILRAWSYVYFEVPVWVSPQPIACELLEQGASFAAEDEQSLERIRGQDEFEELKSFIPGESMARISWAHLARGQGLLSKHFSDPRGQQQMLDYQRMPLASHEMRLSYLAYWVKQFAVQHVAFGLRLPQIELPVGMGDQHVHAALRLLAEQP